MSRSGHPNEPSQDHFERDVALLELAEFASEICGTPVTLSPTGQVRLEASQPLNEVQKKTLALVASQAEARIGLLRRIEGLREEKRRQAERDHFLHIVTDRLPMRVGYIDRNHRYVFLNGEYERQFGFAPGEGAGRSVREIVGRAGYEIAIPFINRALNGETHTQEFPVTYPFGERRVRVSYVADPAPDGSIRGVIVQVQDVTDIYADAQRLREAQARLDGILANEDVATWLLDIGTGQIGGDKNLGVMFGFDPDEARENGADEYIDRIHEDDREKVRIALGDSIEHGRRYEVEFRIAIDGSERWVLSRGTPEVGPDGKVLRIPGVVVDITAQVLARREVERLNDVLEATVAERTAELQDAVREAEAFNYAVAHDLRTPIRMVAASSHILLEEVAPLIDEENRRLLARQCENAVRLGRLVDELLRLSRLAKVDVRREDLDVTALASSVFGEIAGQDMSNGCVLEAQPGMTASADPSLVRTVLYNLLGNACKFSPRGGVVAVRESGGVFSAVDQGVGFPMESAQKIFIPFERLVSETDFQGTGIGLANVERIIRRHGGRVWAESEPGQGATFRFTLGPR